MHPVFHVYSERSPMTALKPTVCQICGCNCGLLVAIEKGRIAHVRGDPDAPQNRGGICIKGKMSPRVLYAPDRLKEPMVRRKNGAGFISASWPDALGEIAARLEKVKENFGPESLAIYRGRSTRFIDRVFIYEKGEFHAEPLKPVPWLQTTESLISPMGAAKPEWRFFAELADQMGFSELARFSDEDELLRQVFSDSGRPDLDPADMRHGMRLTPTAFGKLRGNGFNTPSGKIELYSRQLAEQGYAPLPVAEDVCRCDARYPYRLVTGSRVDAFNHSQHRNIPELLNRCPHPEAEIGPEIADTACVGNGDFLTIETEWGKLDMRARVVEGMNPVTVSIPHGWPGGENANYLVGDVRRDAISGTPAYKAIPCRVKKS
jgi:anaerobic selenocysteine-containing dehydrogenase